MANVQGTRWQRLLQNEHEQRLHLEDMVEQLGKQHSNLEKLIRRTMTSSAQQQRNNPAGAGSPESSAIGGSDGILAAVNNGAVRRMSGNMPPG